MMFRILLSWGPALLWSGFIFWLSSQSWDDAPAGFQINDKVAHLAIFGILGVALAWAGRRLKRRSLHAGLVLLGVLLAASDEWHQSFVALRDPSVGDFLADTLGVILGYFLTLSLLRGRRGTPSSPLV
ncbi:MAG: VanZ family protein [Gemmatimonadetes bacterium]|nr:VanZ family protein [Gemmatimonadota bacterium]NNM07211.1 VanZ family protein [Gemmatimonadota bacterium]